MNKFELDPEVRAICSPRAIVLGECAVSTFTELIDTISIAVATESHLLTRGRRRTIVGGVKTINETDYRILSHRLEHAIGIAASGSYDIGHSDGYEAALLEYSITPLAQQLGSTTDTQPTLPGL